MQRLRIRYAKRGRARFTSHRDFGRAFERALRRAGVPMAYSSGFSPHPRISYANASPTGAASEAEYLEIGLAAACDPEQVRAALDAALPPGLDIVEVVESPPGSLADALTGSRWRIRLVGVPDGVRERGGRRGSWPPTPSPVERMTKNGMRAFDARAAVVALTGDDDGSDRHPHPPGAAGPARRRADRICGCSTEAFDPTEVPVLTRVIQGRLDPETGDDHRAVSGGGRERASGHVGY